jgi:sugar phosphate isomerase/epimerase
MTRRSWLAGNAAALVSAAAAVPQTKMTMALDCGAIGVKASPPQALDYAAQFGFQAMSADVNWLASQSDVDLQRFLDSMKSKRIAWGSAGLPVEFRKSDEEFQSGLKLLPSRAAALKKAGVTRVSTWILPGSASLTYLENLKQHSQRLRECAAILGDQGCMLGLEYVGPKTAWVGNKYPFVHCMKEMKELIAEIGKPNVGFLLDSWHWYTAGENTADLMTLKASQIVSVDLNDAPAGVALDKQVDNVRELPAATGVIAAGEFLSTLTRLGCDAPVRAEPFNAALRAMPPDQALQATITAMKKAFAQIQ